MPVWSKSARALCEARSVRYVTFEAPASSGTSGVGGCLRSVPFPVPGDELIGDVIEVVADDVRLRADPKTSLPARLISAASQPAATAPSVSQVWQATRHSREGSTPSSLLSLT